MSEWNLVALAAMKMLLLTGFVSIYVIGGRTHKWIRRWVGGTLIIIGINIIMALKGNWSFAHSAASLSVYLGLIAGYGATTLSGRISARFIYGLLAGLAGIGPAWIGETWMVLPIHFLFCIAGSVYLGTINPFGNAVDEEGAISLSCMAMIPFMV